MQLSLKDVNDVKDVKNVVVDGYFGLLVLV